MALTRLFLLLLIVGYFATQLRPSAAQPDHAQPKQAVPAPITCPLKIHQAAYAGDELRVTVSGTAEHVAALWDSGQVAYTTPEVCSGGECSLKVPPGLDSIRVVFDNCASLTIGN